jgi:hypothetical protein
MENDLILKGNANYGDVVSNNGVIEVKDSLLIAKLNIDSLWDTGEVEKVVKSTERAIRTSDEYSSYIGYLKEEVGMKRCAIMGGVSDELAEVEFHHYPFSLYDVCSIILSDNVLNGTGTTSIKLAKEVLELHYENLIGVVPLCKTAHELAHAGEIFISLEQVFGDVNEFVERFKTNIPEDMLFQFNKLCRASDKDIPYSKTDVLRKKIKSANIEKYGRPIKRIDLP